MSKQIALWSYWSGVVCVVVMVVLRGLAAFGVYPRLVSQLGAPVGYNTFLRGAVVLLLLSLAARFVGEWQNEKS